MRWHRMNFYPTFFPDLISLQIPHLRATIKHKSRGPNFLAGVSPHVIFPKIHKNTPFFWIFGPGAEGGSVPLTIAALPHLWNDSQSLLDIKFVQKLVQKFCFVDYAVVDDGMKWCWVFFFPSLLIDDFFVSYFFKTFCKIPFVFFFAQLM